MPDLTPEQQAIADVLHRGLCDIRLAAASGDANKAWALADALHNLPGLLGGDGEVASIALAYISSAERYPRELEQWRSRLRPHATKHDE